LADIAALHRELETVKQRAADASRAVNFLYALLNQLPVAVKLETDDGKILFANEVETELSRNADTLLEAGKTSAPAVQPKASVGGESWVAASTVVTTEDRVVGPGGERRSCKSASRLASPIHPCFCPRPSTSPSASDRAVKARLLR
jgi:hypothetical protein